jgi:polysaccharide biosynthesis protein PslH
MADRRPRILYLSSSSLHGKAFGGQMRALHIARALQSIGDVTVVIVASDSDDIETEHRMAGEFPILPSIYPQHLPRRTVLDQIRFALDPGYLNLHGIVASDLDRERVVSYFSQFDLIWVLNSRTPNIIQQWNWPRAHLDMDDIPSTYSRTVAANASNIIARSKARAQQLLLRRREGFFLRRFVTISVCSEADKRYLGADERVHVLPNGFARPLSTPAPTRARPPMIGFIGLYSYPPNLDGVRWFLKECWPTIRQAVPGIRFRLIGKDTDGVLKPSNPAVDALGWIENPTTEIASWSAMIIPIRYGGGTRIKIAEAFSRMCPAVSTDVGAFGYEVRDGDQLRLANTPTEFSRACIDVVTDPVAASQMAERAWHDFLRKWTWEAISVKVIGAAQDCLRRSLQTRSAP